jgi:hypothetical protein
VYRWELEDLAEHQIADLPPRAVQALTALLDAAVIVDPAEYQHPPGEPPRPLRSLHFGPDAEGLVTFLVYEPDQLVLVTRVQWLGD